MNVGVAATRLAVIPPSSTQYADGRSPVPWTAPWHPPDV